MSLYSSLQAAVIQMELVVLFTRKKKLPTKLYPFIYDYNYVFIKVEIAKRLLLNATDLFIPFRAGTFKRA
jgi:hypothetical protein